MNETEKQLTYADVQSMYQLFRENSVPANEHGDHNIKIYVENMDELKQLHDFVNS